MSGGKHGTILVVYGASAEKSDAESGMLVWTAILPCVLRVVPVTLQKADRIMTEWTSRTTSERRRLDLVASAPFYRIASPSSNLGCIAVMDDVDVRALALFERMGSEVLLWDVSCIDNSSGTQLMKAVAATSEERLRYADALHPRWKIAVSFWRPSSEPL